MNKSFLLLQRLETRELEGLVEINWQLTTFWRGNYQPDETIDRLDFVGVSIFSKLITENDEVSSPDDIGHDAFHPGDGFPASGDYLFRRAGPVHGQKLRRNNNKTQVLNNSIIEALEAWRRSDSVRASTAPSKHPPLTKKEILQ